MGHASRTRRHADTPSRRYAVTPLRRYADTPKRTYAYTLPLPNILPRVPKSVEELPIQVRPDLLDCFYHRLSRFFS
jgi:hypothetical protein